MAAAAVAAADWRPSRVVYVQSHNPAFMRCTLANEDKKNQKSMTARLGFLALSHTGHDQLIFLWIGPAVKALGLKEGVEVFYLPEMKKKKRYHFNPCLPCQLFFSSSNCLPFLNWSNQAILTPPCSFSWTSLLVPQLTCQSCLSRMLGLPGKSCASLIELKKRQGCRVRG